MVAFFVCPNGCIKISVDLFVDCYFFIFDVLSKPLLGGFSVNCLQTPCFHGFQRANVFSILISSIKVTVASVAFLKSLKVRPCTKREGPAKP